MEIYNGPWTVYVHQNKINGKCYVGITKKENLNDRWHNGFGYSYNHHFYSSIQKYGWNNFEHVVFASGLTEEEASNTERLLIRKLHTTDEKYGYNVCDGGYLNGAMSGKHNPFWNKVPEKAVEASVKARTGKALTTEHKSKISAGNKGRTKTLEERQKLSESQKGIPRPYIAGSRNGHSKKVICVETGEIFDTITSAAEKNGVTIKAICNAVKGGTRSNNFHWTLL